MIIPHSSLKRVLSLQSMIFYGLGTIVGAGIYVLIGEITSEAGGWSPLAFIMAAFIASFTGLSYAELVSRYPHSGGEVVYVEQAFNNVWLTQLVGWSVVLTGLVSAATLLKGLSGYFIELFGGVEFVVISMSVILICILACSGVRQSVGFTVAVTLLELLGLLLVIFISADELLVIENWQRWKQEASHFSWAGIIGATFLAFYAFIGFEDMVNMAEEVENASVALPKAIIITIIASTIIYLLIATVAVIAVPIDSMVSSVAPLTTLVSLSTWFPSWLMSLISLIAIINGAIVQLLMAPRVVYSLTRQSTQWAFLAKIHPRTQTPIVATIFISALVLCFTLWLPLAFLAKLTSTIILCLFFLINSALIIIKRREPYQGFQVSHWIPFIGIATSLLLLLAQVFILFTSFT